MSIYRQSRYIAIPDVLLQIAQNKQRRYIGDWLHISASLLRKRLKS
jgi:hypothetical protein